MSWQEASAIDWEEVEARKTRRLLRSPRAGGVAAVGSTQAEGIAWFAQLSGRSEAEVAAMWQPGTLGGYGDSVYRVEGKRRRDYVDEGWKLLSASCAFLARTYSEDGVRLIIGWVEVETRNHPTD